MSKKDYQYDRQKYPIDPAATGYAPNNAWWLAAASSLVYESSNAIREAELKKWGFADSRFVSITQKPHIDTQALVCADPEILLIAFRGTEPTDLKDWITDARFELTDGPIKNSANKVHRGFMEALNAAWPALTTAVGELRTNNQALWMTGHSLGAALATLAAARLSLGDGINNQTLSVQGLYTYGQPRTGNSQFVRAFDRHFQRRSFRFVNNNDIVTEIPPMGFLLRYWHIDRLIYIDADGKLCPDVSASRRITDGLKGIGKDIGRLGPDALKDHFMNNYVQATRRYVEDLAAGKQKPIV